MLIFVQNVLTIYIIFLLGRAFALFLNFLLRQLFDLPFKKSTGKLLQHATESQKATFNLFRNIMASQIVLTAVFAVVLVSEMSPLETLNGVFSFDFSDTLMYIALSLLFSFLWVIIVLFFAMCSKRIFYLFTRELKARKPSK